MTQNLETLRELSGQLDEAQKNVQKQIKELENKELVEKMGTLRLEDFGWSVGLYGWHIIGMPRTKPAREYCKAVERGELDSIPQFEKYNIKHKATSTQVQFDVEVLTLKDDIELLQNVEMLLLDITNAKAWTDIDHAIGDAEQSVKEIEEDYQKYKTARQYHRLRLAILKGEPNE